MATWRVLGLILAKHCGADGIKFFTQKGGSPLSHNSIMLFNMVVTKIYQI